MIKEESKVSLVTTFYLANEIKDSNFNLIKGIFILCENRKKNDDGIVEDLDFLGDHTIIAEFQDMYLLTSICI